MEKEIKPEKEKFRVDLNNIMLYLGIVSFLITFWQGYRDIHKDMSDIKERTRAIEIKIEQLEKKGG